MHKPEAEQMSLYSTTKTDFNKPYKTIRLAVTGDVHLNRLEMDIIDTPEFQRLRRLKQLGTTYLVYPTALHTRFDHSIGTLGMSAEMIRAIRENKHNSDSEKNITEEQELLIRLLALLHDIGHIPFGHTLEDEFCIFTRHDHDFKRTDYFLGESSTIGNVIRSHLGEDMYRRFMTIYCVEKGKEDSLEEDLFVYDLVNNTVCADLLDYLLRDSYFCNLKLDMDYRFLKYLYLYNDNGVRRVAVRLWKQGKPTARQDLLSGLVRLLDNRYLIAERVYFHHAKLITGAMIAGAVHRAFKNNEITLNDLYNLGDETLLYKLQQSKDEAVTKLTDAFLGRKLWKKVYELARPDVQAEQANVMHLSVWDTLMNNWWRDANNRMAEEERIASLLGMDSGDLLINCPDKKMALKLAEMKVFWNGSLCCLKDCTDTITKRKLDVIIDSHENLWGLKVSVNPAYKDREEAIREACKVWFTFDAKKKEKNNEKFYKQIVEQMVDINGWANGVTHEKYKEKETLAVKRLVANTATIRNKETVRKIIEDAFTK